MADPLQSAPSPVSSPAARKRRERGTGDCLPFDHPPATLQFWRDLVQPLLERQPTPFYLFSQPPIEAALAELDAHLGQLPVRHWLSCKTQPLRPLLQWWRAQDRGIEVVSEFELQAALHEGFPPERILLNGPAKHHWLPRHATRGLCVNFDSVAEVRALAPLAHELEWTVGLRLNTPEEVDPEHPECPTQFGLTGPEVREALALLQHAGVRPRIAHFHLRTNIASAAVYGRALAQAAELCRAAGFAPEIVGCGGGFPAPHVLTRGGKRLDAQFHLRDMPPVYAQAQRLFPGLRALWLENGRWLTARSGGLVVQVLDVKERRGMRNLICDGGRANHALVSTWEQHELLALPERRGPLVPTTVNGPTCMAFDQIARRPLPADLQPGDRLVWLDAGAYHLPWETHFSHGLAAVLWHDGQQVTVVREREDFADWWGRWR